MAKMISKYFSMDTVIHSDMAKKYNIDNRVRDIDIMGNIHQMGIVMDDVIDVLGKTIVVTSWYRSDDLNKLVSKSKKSKHKIGCAVDFQTDSLDNDYKLLVQKLKKFSKIMIEYIGGKSWIHLEWTGKNAREAMEVYE